MSDAAVVVLFRPAGPWRVGDASGSRGRTARILESDTLFSAVSLAMRDLGLLSEWLEATVSAPGPAVRFSSCFPYSGATLFVVPPRTLWPPPQTSKVRWKAATLVPFEVVDLLAREQPLDEERWYLDPASECLLPIEKSVPRPAPFRIGQRSSAAVDRLGSAATAVHRTACLEFSPGAGMWCAVAFADDDARERWNEPVRSAFRLLADTGVGGERSRGWGHSDEPVFDERGLPVLTASPAGEQAYWLLSLMSPAPDDGVDLTRGAYSLVTRSGRVNGTGEAKRSSRLLSEGSVIFATRPPVGMAHDVAPEGAANPVYRSGFACSLPIPVKGHA